MLERLNLSHINQSVKIDANFGNGSLIWQYFDSTFLHLTTFKTQFSLCLQFFFIYLNFCITLRGPCWIKSLFVNKSFEYRNPFVSLWILKEMVLRLDVVGEGKSFVSLETNCSPLGCYTFHRFLRCFFFQTDSKTGLKIEIKSALLFKLSSSKVSYINGFSPSTIE